MVVFTLCMPLSDDVFLLWCPGLFPQTFLVVELLTLFPQAVFQQPAAVPSLGPCSKLHLPAPRAPAQQETQDSGWGSTELRHRPRARFLLCPALQRLSTVFPFDPLKVSYCASRHPHYKLFWIFFFPLMVGIPPPLQLFTRIAGFFFRFLFSSFLHPSGGKGIFLTLSAIQSLPRVFSR